MLEPWIRLSFEPNPLKSCFLPSQIGIFEVNDIAEWAGPLSNSRVDGTELTSRGILWRLIPLADLS